MVLSPALVNSLDDDDDNDMENNTNLNTCLLEVNDNNFVRLTSDIYNDSNDDGNGDP